MLYELNRTPSRSRRTAFSLVLLAAVVSTAVFQGCSGGSGNTSDITPRQALLHWNQVAIDATGFDYTLSPPQQGGPCRSARAMAIVHIAMFEALNASIGGFHSYTGQPHSGGSLSQSAAVATAAHDTLVALFPSQLATFDQALADDLAFIADVDRKNAGVLLGQTSAALILAQRFLDGSQSPEPVVNVDFICNNNPGFWRQDPVSMNPLALGGHWYLVAPFVLSSADQFRAPAPPPMNSPAYTAAYNEVKDFGGDGITTPTIRTPEQSFAGVYWAYDGTPGLGAAVRLYNQIAALIGQMRGLDEIHFARLFAMVNVALADGALACWESKYYYQLWRPIAGIRESDPGTGPTGLGDGNASTLGDPTWTPLGAPASNTLGPNFTPPFPAYPSGHAVFGGALFQVLRRTFGTDNIPFTFVSDEFNGVTTDINGFPRPLLPRSFSNLSQAEEENGQSRIYLGIHWAYDKTEGITQGNLVGDWIFDNAFQQN